MGAYESPGIYRKMIDEPGPTQPSSMNMVGVAVACPNQIYLNTPRLITGGSEELMSIFGKSEIGYEGYSAAKILAEDTKIYVCNIASTKSGTLKEAEINLVSTDTGSAKDMVTIKALKAGTSGNDLKVVISNSEVGSFDMRILNKNSEPLESWRGVSLDKYSLTYVENIKSDYIAMTALTDGVATNQVSAKTYNLVGGTDSSITVQPSDMVNAINELNDETLGISYLVAPTLSHKKEVVAAMNSALSETGVIRGIICPPKDKLTPKDCIDWANGEGSTDSDIKTSINNSQIAVYAPWGTIFEPDVNGEIEVSPEIEVIRAEIYTQDNFQPWFAPAGEDRGRCKYFLSLLAHFPKKARDVLYGGTNIVNPIAKIGTSGFLIYGQKTSLRDTTRSLTRVNVRNLTNYIRKSVEEGSKGYVFEQNDSYTWDSWINAQNGFMESIKNARGVYGYIVKMEPTDYEIDTNEMPGMISYKPTRTAEFIPITLRLVATSGNL